MLLAATKEVEVNMAVTDINVKRVERAFGVSMQSARRMTESDSGGACLTQRILKGKLRAQSDADRILQTIVPFMLT